MAKDSRVREEMLPNPYIIPLHARPSSSIFSSVKSLAPSIWKCSFSVLISVRRVQRSAGKRLTTSSLWRRWTLVCSACDVNSPALADFSPTKMSLDFPGGSMVKNLPAIQKPLVQSLGQEDLLEEKVATHSSILAWRIPWTEEPGRWQSMGSKSWHNRSNLARAHACVHTHTHTHTHTYIFFLRGFPGGFTTSKEPACQCRGRKRWGFDPWVGKISWRKAWQPTPLFLPREPDGQRSLADCSPWGHKESDMTEWLKLSLSFFFIFFSIVAYHGLLNIVPCALQ